MKRTRIRLTESDLHRIIKESVKRVINEIDDATVARATGNSTLKANNPQAFYQGKSPEYIQRKQRQAKFFQDQKNQRRADRMNGGYQSESDSQYDNRMNKSYYQGRDQAYREAGKMPPRR